ncbi:MAG: UDP-N-acetylmuramoyl-L-alanyl-D-glutamate--2,6-diaminopimelate ligase [Nitrospinae bacterium]|nr:UDP-N-acetylmuramoyl-L-alanyl-D-glutamate--2,6-diaminopimelate ligase [Nitrospinota bacterium]MBL7020253.1 UDP-N-acetylmuramoyl-L-alanyl-D-glutamate--2,6-diaminopimelate ligase [Nitrospinaceae bacterium]
MEPASSTNWIAFPENGYLNVTDQSGQKLSSLILGLPATNILGTMDRNIREIVYDSRKSGPDSLFVAVPGGNWDGGVFIKDAIAKGASAFITQTSLDSLNGFNLGSRDVTALCVEDSRKALSIVSANFYRHPSERIALTGITGTNGKTTTSYILEALFRAQGMRTGVIGTINYHYGDKKLPAPVTTPESLDLDRMLNEMIEDKVENCFLEVSSHALHQSRVHNMCFKVGIFTNLSRDHLDFHGDMESYKNAKKKLFRDNRVQQKIFNIDDSVGREFAEEFKTASFTTGIDSNADFKAEDIVLTESGCVFTLKTPFGTSEINSNLLGRHNVHNLLSAAAGAMAQDISLERIQEVFRQIQPIPGRFEKIENDQGFSVLVDYAHTDDALSNAISAAKTFTKGKLFVVFGCGGDRDKGKRQAMGRTVLNEADFSIITSDNPRTEDPTQIIEEILRGVPSSACEGHDYAAIINRKEAIEYAIHLAGKNDLVLIAGKGHEDYQILGTKTIHFDDREVARSALRKRNH